MTNTQIIKRSQELERKVYQLIDLSKDLLNENSRRSDQIENLSLEKIEINDRIIDVYLLLLPEIEQNTFFEIDPNNPIDILDGIRVLTQVLLHNSESSERENKVLQKLIKRKK